jgi:predicted NAD/FAD-binding protein
MTISVPVRRIAVIGAGPSGLSAVKYEDFRYCGSFYGHIT